MLTVSLQWYKLHSETLMGKVLELNPYDRCVENKMVNGKKLLSCGMWMATKCGIWKKNKYRTYSTTLKYFRGVSSD